MLDAREPPHGDFVAYVEKIEREQLARAMQPHRLPQVSAGGTVAPADPPRALSASEAQRVLQSLQAQAGRNRAPVGTMIGIALGAALIAFGLLAEGGIFLVLLGAALLWHHLRKLSARRAEGDSPAQRVDQLFGRNAPGTPRKRAT